MLQDERNFRSTGDAGASAVNSITRITSALSEQDETVNSILILWNFVFLSHPAVDTYLNYKIRGHVDWIKIGCFFSYLANNLLR